MLSISKCKSLPSSDFLCSFIQGDSGGWYWVLFRGTSGQSSEVILSDLQEKESDIKFCKCYSIGIYTDYITTINLFVDITRLKAGVMARPILD